MENQFNNQQHQSPLESTPKTPPVLKFTLPAWLTGLKPKKFASIFVVILMAAISLLMVSVLLNRKNISLNPDDNTGAANPSCYVALTRKTPTPLTPSPSTVPTITPTPVSSKTPTPTPKPSTTSTPVAGGVCDITFIPSNHQAVCWPDPRIVTVTYKVNSLPTNEVYYMQTDWFVAAPNLGPHHYTYTPIQAGQTYTFTAEWPGVSNPPPSVVEIHAGLNVYNSKGQLLTPNCSKGLDYFWTPYVCKLP